MASSRDEDHMDVENRRLADQLSSKVSHLKSLAFDIEEEVKEHNRIVDGMGIDFESARGLLTGSVNKVHKLLASGKNNRRLTCYVALGIVAITFLFYSVVFRSSK